MVLRTDEWKPTKLENPTFKCTECGSDDVYYRIHNSSCGGYEDYCYDCHNCGKIWWIESSDA